MDDTIDRYLAKSRPYAAPAVILGAVVLGYLRGPGSFVLTLAGGALLFAVFSLWGAVRVLVGEAPVDVEAAIAIAETADESETKRILGALADLKQEKQLGKLSEEDFDALSAQYRAEAKALLRRKDELLAPARAKAEALLAERLAARAPADGAKAPTADDADGDAKDEEDDA